MAKSCGMSAFGAKRTSQIETVMSANDPRRTLADYKHAVRRSICFSTVQTSIPRMSCPITGESDIASSTPEWGKNCPALGERR